MNYMSLNIKYGIENNIINITEKALENCLFGTILYIPIPNRTELFGDPLPGIHKFIFIAISRQTKVDFSLRSVSCFCESKILID